MSQLLVTAHGDLLRIDRDCRAITARGTKDGQVEVLAFMGTGLGDSFYISRPTADRAEACAVRDFVVEEVIAGTPVIRVDEWLKNRKVIQGGSSG